MICEGNEKLQSTKKERGDGLFFLFLVCICANGYNEHLF
ncbi:hypothetical protein BASH2_02055 [Bacillus anthracis]|nr:hypothetical protein BASH2_02055 [Bacillus anthracis]